MENAANIFKLGLSNKGRTIQRRTNKVKKTVILMLCLLLCVSFLAGCSAADSVAGELAKQKAYSEAMKLLDEGDALQAYDLLQSISDYRDVSEYLDRFVFRYDHVTIKESGETIEILYEYDNFFVLLKQKNDSKEDLEKLYMDIDSSVRS